MEIFPVEDGGGNGGSNFVSQSLFMDASDIDLGGSLAKTVLIVIHFSGYGSGSIIVMKSRRYACLPSP